MVYLECNNNKSNKDPDNRNKDKISSSDINCISSVNCQQQQQQNNTKLQQHLRWSRETQEETVAAAKAFFNSTTETEGSK